MKTSLLKSKATILSTPASIVHQKKNPPIYTVFQKSGQKEWGKPSTIFKQSPRTSTCGIHFCFEVFIVHNTQKPEELEVIGYWVKDDPNTIRLDVELFTRGNRRKRLES